MFIDEVLLTVAVCGGPLRFQFAYTNSTLQKKNSFIASNDDSVFRSGGLELPEALIAPLCATIRRRMTPTPVKMNAKVKVQCYEYEGILAVKAALLAGLAHNDENKEENPHATTLDVTVIAPPHYGLVTTSMGKEPGLKKMEAALASIEKEILRRKGTYALELAPVVVSGVDDEKMHADQLEVKKDEDSDSDSGSDSDVEGMGI
jgi:translation initiation factor 2 subunit 1